MSLSNALSSSVSGLAAASTQISIIGDNIANANTPGFKEKRAEFTAILGQNITAGSGFAQIGAGVRVQDVSMIFSQGVFEQTQRGTDLGIEGKGFFVLEGNLGRSYTRSGAFGFDADGWLVDPAANRVQGYGIDPTTGNSNGVLGDIRINVPLSPPQGTTQIQLAKNLKSTSPVIAGGFDANNPQATSNAQEVVTIYDSLGTPRQATIFFTHTAANQWDFNVTLSAADAAGTPASPPFIVQAGGSGTLDFDSSGNLTGVNGGTTYPTVNFAFDTTNGAAASQAIDFSMGQIVGGPVIPGPTSTQFDTASVTNFVSQDGFAPGTLSALQIDEQGRLNGVFSNGVTTSLAQLSLANFGNVEGLTDIGGSRLIESLDSGPPIIAAAGSGNLGNIRASSLEKSNVDLAQQFVNLIIGQRAFQANTRTVSVTNELLSNLVNLGQ
ncbi:MAG: flagellar hook protein FlgE [Myxococcota bacterium]